MLARASHFALGAVLLLVARVTRANEPTEGGPYVIECTCPREGPTLAHCPPCPEQLPHPLSESFPRAERGSSGYAGVLIAEIGGHATRVDLPRTRDGFGGGAGGRVLLIGHSDAFVYRAVASGTLGYQTTGALTELRGDASLGSSLALGEPSRLFLRGGLELDGHKDDEVEVSVITLPSAAAGLQLTTDRILFELGPRGGLALRALYAPGDEDAGRRRHRPSDVAPAWGGFVTMLSTFLVLDTRLTRVEERRGLWLAGGDLCVPVPPAEKTEAFVLCAAAEHVEGSVVSPAGDRRDVGSWTAGLSVGFGALEFKLRR